MDQNEADRGLEDRDMDGTLTEAIVTIVAIVLTVGIVPLGMYMDHRKRRMIFEERRLMIERGMQPPAEVPEPNPLAFLKELGAPKVRDARSAVEACLRRGIVLLFLGLGLWAGDYVLNQRAAALASSGVHPFVASGTLAAVGSICGLTGLGNLIYYGLARRRSILA